MGEKIYPYFQWLVGPKGQGDLIFGHHYAFGLPGILMALATLLFWMGRHHFNHLPPAGKSYFRGLIKGENLHALARLWLIFSFVVLFWALFDQIGTLWQIQCRELDRTLPAWLPLFAGYEILPAQVSAVFNPLFILLLVPVFNRFIYPSINRFFPLTQLRKMGIGLWLMVLAFLVATGVQECVEGGQSLHVGWQILACLILTASEVMVSITCLEFAYTQAPHAMKSLVMALFLLTVSLGNYLTSAVKFILIDESGDSRLQGSEEFWFWTLLMAAGSALFIEVARRYRTAEQIQ